VVDDLESSKPHLRSKLALFKTRLHTLKQKIPGILKVRSKVERFGSTAVVRSQKLGDITENMDFTLCLKLEDLTPTFS